MGQFGATADAPQRIWLRTHTTPTAPSPKLYAVAASDAIARGVRALQRFDPDVAESHSSGMSLDADPTRSTTHIHRCVWTSVSSVPRSVVSPSRIESQHEIGKAQRRKKIAEFPIVAGSGDNELAILQSPCVPRPAADGPTGEILTPEQLQPVRSFITGDTHE